MRGHPDRYIYSGNTERTMNINRPKVHVLISSPVVTLADLAILILILLVFGKRPYCRKKDKSNKSNNLESQESYLNWLNNKSSLDPAFLSNLDLQDLLKLILILKVFDNYGYKNEQKNGQKDETNTVQKSSLINDSEDDVAESGHEESEYNLYNEQDDGSEEEIQRTEKSNNLESEESYLNWLNNKSSLDPAFLSNLDLQDLLKLILILKVFDNYGYKNEQKNGQKDETNTVQESSLINDSEDDVAEWGWEESEYNLYNEQDDESEEEIQRTETRQGTEAEEDDKTEGNTEIRTEGRTKAGSHDNQSKEEFDERCISFGEKGDEVKNMCEEINELINQRGREISERNLCECEGDSTGINGELTEKTLIKYRRKYNSASKLSDNLRRDYRGATVTALLPNAVAVKGEVVFNFDHVIALKCEKTIIFINEDDIIAFV